MWWQPATPILVPCGASLGLALQAREVTISAAFRTLDPPGMGEPVVVLFDSRGRRRRPWSVCPAAT